LADGVETAPVPPIILNHGASITLIILTGQLESVAAAVHDLELEFLESSWELHQLKHGIKRSSSSRVTRAFLGKCEECLRGYSVFLMALGVTSARRAAYIRSRLSGKAVHLDFDKTKGITFPLDPDLS
jgi:hypothetical protein